MQSDKIHVNVPQGGTGGHGAIHTVKHPHNNFGGKHSHHVSESSGQQNSTFERYHSMPLIIIQHPDGTTQPAPFLMRQDELIAFLRLYDCNIKFPEKTIQRYRRMGLRTVRVGKRVWFRLDDVLRFLDEQQERL